MTKEAMYVAMELWGAIFCFIATICLALLYFGKDRAAPFLMISSIIVGFEFLADSVAWLFRGVPGESALFLLKLSNALTFFFGMCAIFSILPYSLASRGECFRKSPAFWTNLSFSTIFFGMLIVNSFEPFIYDFDSSNRYYRLPAYKIVNLFPVLSLVVGAFSVFHGRKNVSFTRFLATFLICVIPAVFLGIQTFVYGYSLANFAMIFCGILVFFELIFSNVKTIKNQSDTINHQNGQLRNLQTKIAFSQIRPHFLYNALNSIYVLCGIDAEKGRNALSELSDYIRLNIMSIEIDHSIPFERELEIVKMYIALENLRFSGKIQVEYNLLANDFALPALTVQPIVENAVRHGFASRSNAGKIVIQSQKTNGGYLVFVSDNGKGFDVRNFSTLLNDSTKIGIRNVRERLSILSGGSIKIDSKIGEGTKVQIFIPKNTWGGYYLNNFGINDF